MTGASGGGSVSVLGKAEFPLRAKSALGTVGRAANLLLGAGLLAWLLQTGVLAKNLATAEHHF